MGYYDNVKDEVRDNNEEDDSVKEEDNEVSGNFGTLKEKAEQTADDEGKGDDTPIEVLEEDGLQEKPSQSQEKRETSEKHQSESPQRDSKNSENQGNPLTAHDSGSEISKDLTGVEEKLDKMIEQNKRMIEILESFGQ